MARPPATGPSSAAGTATATITVEDTTPSLPQQQTQSLVLRLNRKKKVTWKEGTVDNEFMQKKSSKKCCIFHKQKPFDEDSSDEEDDRDRSNGPDGSKDVAHDHDHGCCSHQH